jgi:hypothetical protein
MSTLMKVKIEESSVTVAALPILGGAVGRRASGAADRGDEMSASPEPKATGVTMYQSLIANTVTGEGRTKETPTSYKGLSVASSCWLRLGGHFKVTRKLPCSAG